VFSVSRAQPEIKFLVQPKIRAYINSEFHYIFSGIISELMIDADLYRVSFVVAVYSFISLLQSTLHRA